MRILVPDEKPTKVRRERTRKRRKRRAFVGAGIAILLAALYLFPGAPPPEDLYASVDGRVLQSLFESRGDFPLQHIDVGGKIWSYRTAGDGPEGVIFLHGFGGASDIWWQQIRALRNRYTVIAANYGRIRSLDESSAGIAAIMEAEGLSEAHIVGTSLGGYVAQHFVEEMPGRAASVVLANSFPPGKWIRGEVRLRGLLAPITPTWMLMGGFRSSVRRDVYPASGNSALVRDYLIEQSFVISRGEFLTRLALLRDDFDPPDLAGLGVPTLIIESDNDPLVPPEAREALRDTYPGADVTTLSEAGHFPYLNRPAEYTRTLESFFASFRPASRVMPAADSVSPGDSLAIPDTTSGGVSPESSGPR